MTGKAQFDIRIDTKDPEIINSIETTLGSLKPTRQEAYRDLATIITVAASAVSLAKGLIEVWQQIRHLRDSPRVNIEAESGAQLNLTTTKSAKEIEKFIAQNAGE